jgi:hypothetical protein
MQTLPCVVVPARAMIRLLTVALLISACAPSLVFNQTFLVPEDLKLAPNGYASLKSTGESLDLGPIKAQEKGADRVQIIKVHGAYVLVGDGFQRAWRLWPDGKDEMHYKPLDLSPGTKGGFASASLEASGNCALLRWQKGGAPAQAYVNSDGDADDKKCPQ